MIEALVEEVRVIPDKEKIIIDTVDELRKNLLISLLQEGLDQLMTI